MWQKAWPDGIYLEAECMKLMMMEADMMLDHNIQVHSGIQDQLSEIYDWPIIWLTSPQLPSAWDQQG